MDTIVILAVASVVCVGLIVMLRNTGAWKSLAVNGLGGLAAFGVVNLTGLATGISLVPNLWTIGSAALLGIPGIVGLMFIKLILHV